MPADLLEIELFGREMARTGLRRLGRTGLGKLEIGEKGTLLLDEITEMPLAIAIETAPGAARQAICPVRATKTG